MATGSSRVAGTAAASPPLNNTGRPSDYHAWHGIWAPWHYYNNIQTKRFSRLTILTLYLFFLLGTQMWGNWCSACKRAAPLVNSSGKPAVGLLLDAWSQYIIFSKVLDDSRAWWVQRERHRQTITVSTKRKPAIIFCAILLLCGDEIINLRHNVDQNTTFVGLKSVSIGV